MNTVTLSPTSSVGAKYWSELKDLSNSVKLELITLLSNSVANSVSEPSDEKGWTKSFAGRWQDDRSAEEIIEDIRASRNANKDHGVGSSTKDRSVALQSPDHFSR